MDEWGGLDSFDDAIRERRFELEEALSAIVAIEDAVGVPVEKLLVALRCYYSAEVWARMRRTDDD